MSTASPECPTYLAGRFAPVPDEIDAIDLPVEGALPPELDGRYLRNGPNPLPGTDGGASQLLVLDAADVTRRVAAVTLSRGVPAGFHGSWVDR